MTGTTEQESFVKRASRFLGWTRRLLLITGTLAVSYVALTLLNAQLYQNAANHTLDQQIHAEEQHTASQPKPVVKEGDVLGRMVIQRLGLSVAVLQGTTQKTLLLGVGHIEGTALPGEAGNIGIAGHRDTYFRVLKDIRTNDEIQLQTTSGVARYEVDWIQITAPGDGGIVAPASESALTLVTCYPFHYVGAAPERFVVHAHSE
jgi:sortase A